MRRSHQRQHCPEFLTHHVTTEMVDYAAKIHVDGNNHGPRNIFGLDEHQRSGLWIYDVEIATRMLDCLHLLFSCIRGGGGATNRKKGRAIHREGGEASNGEPARNGEGEERVPPTSNGRRTLKKNQNKDLGRRTSPERNLSVRFEVSRRQFIR